MLVPRFLHALGFFVAFNPRSPHAFLQRPMFHVRQRMQGTLDEERHVVQVGAADAAQRPVRFPTRNFDRSRPGDCPRRIQRSRDRRAVFFDCVDGLAPSDRAVRIDIQHHGRGGSGKEGTEDQQGQRK